MKVSLLGSDGTILTQLGALREGFAALGHQHTFDYGDPDVGFVFVGNPPFEPYLDLVRSGARKVIFNVLDTCVHCPEHEEIVSRLKHQLPLASRVTAISQTVAAELKAKCGVDAHVIYYPSKKVSFTGVRRFPQFRAMMVGRLGDANKRAGSAVQALIRAGFNEDEVAIVGPEYLGWGARMGVVSDEVLNDLYNSVDYVMMLSKNEGIGLPAIEAAMAGAIPIVAPDLSTFNEFWAESPLGLHYQLLNSPDTITKLIRDIESNPTWKAQIKQDMLGYAELKFRPKFDRVKVAERIFSVYQSI